MEEGGPFRFIVTGYYKSITIDQDQVNINDSHYLNGAIFNIRDNKILDDKGLCMVWDNNRICLSSDSTHKILLDPINHGLSFMMYNDYYIDDNFNLQEDEDDAMLVQLAGIDDLNDLQPFSITDFNDTPISADGIPLTSGSRFCLSICDDIGNTEISEIDSKLIFGSGNYSQGVDFKFVRYNDILLFKIPLEGGYLGIDQDEHGTHSMFQVTDIPELPIIMVPTRYDTIFILSDGEHYYRVEFWKGSYGEIIRVDKKKRATRFQLISIAP